MPKFVAVIGERNSGKSTVIRSLTGAPRNNFRGFVRDNATDRCIYVVCGSPQEQPLLPAALSTILREAKADRSCKGVVMAIQPSTPRTRLSLEDIFKAVTAAGGFQIHAFVLDPAYSSSTLAGARLTAGLKKLRVKFVALDARRFSLLNAITINRRTHIAS